MDIRTHMRRCIATYQQQGEGEDLPSAPKDAVTVPISTDVVLTDVLTVTSGGSTGSVTILRLLPSKDGRCSTSGVLEAILP